jgi:hydrogenase nickel incorporation protein HypA/HybF
LPALGDRARVSAVHVRIGALSGVAPESLRFSFDVVAAGSIIEGARLEIECVRTTIWCEGCGTEREAEDDRLLCTRCGQPSPRVVRGRELELAAVEVVDDADR